MYVFSGDNTTYMHDRRTGYSRHISESLSQVHLHFRAPGAKERGLIPKNIFADTKTRGRPHVNEKSRNIERSGDSFGELLLVFLD